MARSRSSSRSSSNNSARDSDDSRSSGSKTRSRSPITSSDERRRATRYTDSDRKYRKKSRSPTVSKKSLQRHGRMDNMQRSSSGSQSQVRPKSPDRYDRRHEESGSNRYSKEGMGNQGRYYKRQEGDGGVVNQRYPYRPSHGVQGDHEARYNPGSRELDSRSSNSYHHSSGKRPDVDQRDEFMMLRRQEREKIGLMGVPEVWSVTPERQPTDSDDEIEDDMKATIKREKNGHFHGGSSEDIKKSKTRKHKKKSQKKQKKKKKSKNNKSKVESTIASEERSSDDRSDSESAEEDMWVEKTKKEGTIDEVVIGPQPISTSVSSKGGAANYGHALLPGEGEAMAAYVAEGKRIPRRGEIGLTSNEIEDYEAVGYVMSGSRHRRMEAVRLRKENQVYSADEKRALALFNHEARSKKEAVILGQFREMISSKAHSKG
ncbi:PREDICTED: UPF0396 protein CG6066-like [Priapulus caudatus]|uniref:UPF0396 protein CG6066-like n=1 Tax=Priapulus caudatus TaxID=37621 RepID=A0ABM1DYM5_PRICU|nr:PREDICTED: UPF0396 protein CG6066-like [Priapulus caudatus]XP_014665047.1 PREDICTED: UPF0396 protein CG6066-like [Priapulus caudatus]